MYAIVEIAGQQFKVERGNKVYVHRLEANEGSKVEFDKVLLLDNDGKISIGNPTSPRQSLPDDWITDPSLSKKLSARENHGGKGSLIWRLITRSWIKSLVGSNPLLRIERWPLSRNKSLLAPITDTRSSFLTRKKMARWNEEASSPWNLKSSRDGNGSTVGIWIKTRFGCSTWTGFKASRRPRFPSLNPRIRLNCEYGYHFLQRIQNAPDLRG